MRYIDMSEAQPQKDDEESADEEREDPEYADTEPEELDRPEPSVQGACCLPDGGCLDTDEEECAEYDGEFHRGADCDEIECEPQSP